MGGAPAKYFQHTASRYDTIGTVPEWRLTEVDQTDPAGRWRHQLNSDTYKLQSALTANWGSALDYISIVREASGGSTTDIDLLRPVFVMTGTTLTNPSIYEGLTARIRIAITTGASSDLQIGLTGFVSPASTNSQNLTATPVSVMGVLGYVSPQGVALGDAYTITAAAGLVSRASTIGANVTVTDYYGAYVGDMGTVSGILTNAYGLYIETIDSAATLNRAIFTAGGITEFNGNLQLDAVFDHNPAALSGTPATTGAWLDQASQTFTDNNTAASGTAAAMAFNSFQRPTLAATNLTVTTTNAATLYIANSPLAGDNQTITNAWALWVDAGNVRLDGNLTFNQASTISTITGTLTLATTAADADITLRVNTATTNGVEVAWSLLQRSTGTVAVGFGARLNWELEDDAGVDTSAGGVALAWTNLTGANIGSKMVFYVSNNSGSVASPLALFNADDLKIEVDGGYDVRSANATEIGFNVTNGALTVGSAGSIVAPYLSQTGAAFTDAIGGNLDGCIGINYDSDTGPTTTLEVRSQGAWLSVALAGMGIQAKVPYRPNSAWVHRGQLFQADGREWLDETRCVVCGEPLEVGKPALPWVNARNGEGDLHALFGHLHLEREPAFVSLEERVAALEEANRILREENTRLVE